MIISLSTLLARARRHKETVLIFTLSNLEILEAVLKEAELSQKPTVLLLDTTKPHTLPTSNLINYCLERISCFPTSVALVITVEDNEGAVKQALKFGAPALSLTVTEETAKIHTLQFTKWMAQLAHKQEVEVLGKIGSFMTTNRAAAFVEETGVQALSMPVAISNGDQSLVSTSHIHELAAAIKVPLIAWDLENAHSSIKRSLRAGVAGFIIEDSLEQAYTAGIRTALRSRSQYQPYFYQSLAMKAVSQTVGHYFQYVNN